MEIVSGEKRFFEGRVKEVAGCSSMSMGSAEVSWTIFCFCVAGRGEERETDMVDRDRFSFPSGGCRQGSLMTKYVMNKG